MGALKQKIKQLLRVVNGYRWRLKANGAHPPRFSGAFLSRQGALDSQAKNPNVGYDNADIVDVSFDAMSQVLPWDYPVLFWLQNRLSPGMTLLDAGGHLGTKYLAFRNLLDLSAINWRIYDVPAIVEHGRKLQAEGTLPEEIAFSSDLQECATPDILLASGLLQYLDTPFSDMVKGLAKPPQTILVNKVAMSNGAAIFTLEQIGSAKVPYQMRDKIAFEAEIADMGYRIVDCWKIPELSHTIATHPLVGQSESFGYLLEKG